MWLVMLATRHTLPVTTTVLSIVVREIHSIPSGSVASPCSRVSCVSLRRVGQATRSDESCSVSRIISPSIFTIRIIEGLSSATDAPCHMVAYVCRIPSDWPASCCQTSMSARSIVCVSLWIFHQSLTKAVST